VYPSNTLFLLKSKNSEEYNRQTDIPSAKKERALADAVFLMLPAPHDSARISDILISFLDL
jgi:hypothetical protein